MEGTGWDVGVPTTGVGNVEGSPEVGRDLCCLPPEHSISVNCDQAHYGPVSVGGATPRDKGV